jgi:hypothetical protein
MVGLTGVSFDREQGEEGAGGRNVHNHANTDERIKALSGHAGAAPRVLIVTGGSCQDHRTVCFMLGGKMPDKCGNGIFAQAGMLRSMEEQEADGMSDGEETAAPGARGFPQAADSLRAWPAHKPISSRPATKCPGRDQIVCRC